MSTASIEYVIHADRKLNAIKAEGSGTAGCPLEICISAEGFCGQKLETAIVIYTGSEELSFALAEAINGVMERFSHQSKEVELVP